MHFTVVWVVWIVVRIHKRPPDILVRRQTVAAVNIFRLGSQPAAAALGFHTHRIIRIFRNITKSKVHLRAAGLAQHSQFKGSLVGQVQTAGAERIDDRHFIPSVKIDAFGKIIINDKHLLFIVVIGNRVRIDFQRRQVLGIPTDRIPERTFSARVGRNNPIPKYARSRHLLVGFVHTVNHRVAEQVLLFDTFGNFRAEIHRQRFRQFDILPVNVRPIN